jgi:hypothetical protein
VEGYDISGLQSSKMGYTKDLIPQMDIV